MGFMGLSEPGFMGLVGLLRNERFFLCDFWIMRKLGFSLCSSGVVVARWFKSLSVTYRLSALVAKKRLSEPGFIGLIGL